MRSSDKTRRAESAFLPGSAEEFSASRKKALSLLEAEDRTEAELLRKLFASGFSEEASEAALRYVRSFHYTDDLRYAGNFIRNRCGRKSTAELRMLLLAKGVAAETIEEALAQEPFDEAESIKNLYRKKYGSRINGSDPKELEKAVRYFAGKGYGFDRIREGIRRALDEEGDET